MPFSAEACNGDGVWRRVDITTMRTPKLDLQDHELRCPDEDCAAPYIIRHGAVITPHFAHKSNQSTRNCIFMAGAGESPEHQLAKRNLISDLRRYPEYEGAVIEPERILRNSDHKRIADVFVTFVDGATEAHEIQLAKTTIEECRQRTSDYLALGVNSVIWWFGGANRHDSALRQWAIGESGIVGFVDFSERDISLGTGLPFIR